MGREESLLNSSPSLPTIPVWKSGRSVWALDTSVHSSALRHLRCRAVAKQTGLSCTCFLLLKQYILLLCEQEVKGMRKICVCARNTIKMGCFFLNILAAAATKQLQRKQEVGVLSGFWWTFWTPWMPDPAYVSSTETMDNPGNSQTNICLNICCNRRAHVCNSPAFLAPVCHCNKILMRRCCRVPRKHE